MNNATTSPTVTPAEERAEREGLPVVLLVPFECLRIAGGDPMIARTADGNEVLVRLATEDEFYDAHLAACETYGAEPQPREAVASKARPLNLGGVW